MSEWETFLTAVTHSCNEIHYNVMKFITKKRATRGGYALARDRPPDRSQTFRRDRKGSPYLAWIRPSVDKSSIVPSK